MRRSHRFLQVWVALGAGTWTAAAFAQHDAAVSDPAVSAGGKPSLPESRPPEEASIGDTPDALPGLYRLGVPGLSGPRMTAALHAAYGYTEPQNEEESNHHRINGTLALAFAPIRYVGFGLRADIRHDLHGEDALGKDAGTVLDLTPLVRVGTRLESDLHLGAEARLRLPGATGGTSGISPEVDARALFAYSGIPSWMFGLMGGYRMGHRGSIVEESANMRPGDRVSLGLSEFDALLLGLGAMKRFHRTEVFVEVTSDFLIGNGAPSFPQSPLHATVGARHPLLENLWLNAAVDVVPLGRAPSLPGDPLVPIEPRVAGTIGVIYRFLTPKKAAPVAPLSEPSEQTSEETQAKESDEPEEKGPPPIVRSSLHVTVVDQNDHPISDAKIQVEVPSEENRGAETMGVPLESRNSYRLDGIPVGHVEVVIQADLLKPHTESVAIVEGKTAEVEVQLMPAATVGSQLRGLVRSYSGEGIAASVTVEPGGHTAKCDSEGVFELDLPPGVYKVIIEAEGYRSQRRTLRVRKEGVTVLNADLQQAAP